MSTIEKSVVDVQKIAAQVIEQPDAVYANIRQSMATETAANVQLAAKAAASQQKSFGGFFQPRTQKQDAQFQGKAAALNPGTPVEKFRAPKLKLR